MVVWIRVVTGEVVSSGQSGDILKVESIAYVKRFDVWCERC